MSVRVNQRSLSKIQFIDTARELVVHTITYARKFPKSAMFFITKDIVDTARAVYKNVLGANSLYPTSPINVEIRYKYLRAAIAALHQIDALLGIAKSLFPVPTTDADGKVKGVSEYGWVHWSELITTEENLVKGVIKSDGEVAF